MIDIHRLTMQAALAAALCLSAMARADDFISPTDERLRISLGAMRVSSSTDLRVDSSTGVTGTPLNAEREFGLDAHDVEPKFQAVVRVAKRHRLFFDYFTLDRSGSTILNRQVLFRDVVLNAQDPVQTQLSLRTLGIGYEYSFWHSERIEIAASFGVHATDVSARARVTTQTRHVDQREDQAGPVPTLGLDATWAISKRFYLEARGQYLKVNISNIDGSLGLYEFNALYRYRANLALGVGYNDVRAHLDSTKRTQAGMFDFKTHGPQIFLRVAF